MSEILMSPFVEVLIHSNNIQVMSERWVSLYSSAVLLANDLWFDCAFTRQLLNKRRVGDVSDAYKTVRLSLDKDAQVHRP